jgi:hypothetical protein
VIWRKWYLIRKLCLIAQFSIDLLFLRLYILSSSLIILFSLCYVFIVPIKQNSQFPQIYSDDIQYGFLKASLSSQFLKNPRNPIIARKIIWKADNIKLMEQIYVARISTRSLWLTFLLHIQLRYFLAIIVLLNSSL